MVKRCYKDAKKINPSCVFLQKMSAYRRDFDETKYKFGEKLKIVSKMNLIVSQCTTNNI